MRILYEAMSSKEQIVMITKNRRNKSIRITFLLFFLGVLLELFPPRYQVALGGRGRGSSLYCPSLMLVSLLSRWRKRRFFGCHSG